MSTGRTPRPHLGYWRRQRSSACSAAPGQPADRQTDILIHAPFSPTSARWSHAPGATVSSSTAFPSRCLRPRWLWHLDSTEAHLSAVRACCRNHYFTVTFQHHSRHAASTLQPGRGAVGDNASVPRADMRPVEDDLRFERPDADRPLARSHTMSRPIRSYALCIARRCLATISTIRFCWTPTSSPAFYLTRRSRHGRRVSRSCAQVRSEGPTSRMRRAHGTGRERRSRGPRPELVSSALRLFITLARTRMQSGPWSFNCYLLTRHAGSVRVTTGDRPQGEE